MKDYLAGNESSFLRKIDIRLKIIFAFVLSGLVVLVDSLPALTILTFAGLLFYLATKPNISQIKLMCLTIIPFIWGLMVSQGIFYNRFPRTVLFELLAPNMLFNDGLRIYIQGVHYGLIQSLRMVAMVFTGYAICFSTPVDTFLQGLIALKIPFSISFMAATAMRFIPVAAREFTIVRDAMKLKGYQPFKNGITHTIKMEVLALRPILTGSIRRSEEIALSIITRGFTFENERSSLHEHRFKAHHWLVIILFFSILIAVFAIKLLFWLYQLEIYYTPELRSLYSFSRNWL